ncbi:glucose uptake inhibitor SgrT [Pectobacterium carotovorum]|nr:glucose uptake inhibitor SgrT [Pectobacterium carotovorum]
MLPQADELLLQSRGRHKRGTPCTKVINLSFPILRRYFATRKERRWLMAVSRLYRFYQTYLSTCKAKWLRWMSTQQRVALLQQATQWHLNDMSDEEYRHWL